MSAWVVASITFACVFGGALVGMMLRRALPEHHLSEESKDTVKLVTGLIATLSALVLGLLIASAKNTFDAVGEGLRETSAKTILMDRALAQYGSETKDVRQILRDAYTARLAQLFAKGAVHGTASTGLSGSVAADLIEQRIRALSPSTELQHSLQSRALQLSYEIRQARWSVFEEPGSSTPPAFLAVLVFWLASMFASFGLFAPRNRTTLIALAIGALSVSTAIFLIEELNNPLGDTIRVDSTSMRRALDVLGK